MILLEKIRFLEIGPYAPLQKRTCLKTLYQKADREVAVSKDTLITTLKFDKIGTMTINYGKDKKKL